MNENKTGEHIVSFIYCRFCEHKNQKDISEPCFDCLDHPTNINSRRPIHFKDNGSLARIEKSVKKEN